MNSATRTELQPHNLPWPTSPSIKSDALKHLPTAADLECTSAAAQQAHVDSAGTPGDNGKRKNAQEILEGYARTECFSFCSKVARLSRELRDLIYSYLTYEQQVYMTCPTYKRKRPRHASIFSEPSPRTPLERLEMRLKHHNLLIKTQTPEHIWNAYYVGAWFLEEMIENWYRTTTFCLDFNAEPDVLTIGLKKSQLQAIQRIKCLKITIKDFSSMGGYHHTTDENLDQIVKNMRLLQKGSRVQIFFKYFDGSCVIDQLGEVELDQHCKFAERVLPWLQRIEQAGYDVSLHLDGLEFKIDVEESVPALWIQGLTKNWEKRNEEFIRSCQNVDRGSHDFLLSSQV